jgi:glycosyltransferase involved in cell wall biosynthesis
VFTEKTKTILIVISNYLPGFKLGGPVASISNLINNLSDYYNFKILTSDRDFEDKKSYPGIIKNTWLQRDNHKIFYLKRNLFTLYYLIYFIIRTPADILYLNSFFDPLFSISLVIAKKVGILKIKTLIVAPRGELLEGCLKFKYRKKALFIWFAKSLDLFKDIYWHASTVDESKDIIKLLNVKESKVRVALNMSDVNENDESLNEIYYNDCEEVEKKYLRLVFLSRISKEKNLIYALEVLRNVKSEVLFDIYGPIEDEGVWHVCLENIKKLPLNVIVSYKGLVDRAYVKKTFLCYDLFFFPSVGENYGHVISESLSVGTPVLLSDKTPWRNLEEKGWGWDLSLNNPQLFVETIHKMATYPKSYLKETRKMIKNSFIEHLKKPEILNANKELFMIPFKDA